MSRTNAAVIPPTAGRRRWAAWSHWRCALALGSFQTAWFLLVYGGASYVTSLHSYRVRVHFDAELAIPFVPSMVVLYLSIFALFAVTPLFLRRRRELRALARTMAAATLVSGIGFVLLPADVAFARRPTPDTWGGLLHFADLVNLDYNQLPSLHVALSVISIDACSRRAGALGKGLLWCWAAAICFSTVLIHEHHVLDVITGIGLAVVATKSVQRRRIASSRRVMP